MPFIWTPRTKDRQPQGGIARVNPSGIAANGLKALFDLSSGRELISGVGPTTVPVERKATATGVGAKFAGSGELVYAHRPSFVILGDITIVAFVDVDSFSNYSAIISKQETTTTHCPYELRLGGSAAANSNIQLLRTSGSLDAMDGLATLPSPKPGMFISAGHSVSAGVNRYCYDGVVQDAAGRSTSAATDNGGSNVIIAGRSDGFTHFNGTMFWIALFARFLAADELVELKRRPWQFFAPQRTPVFYSIAGVSPGPSTANRIMLLRRPGLSRIWR